MARIQFAHAELAGSATTIAQALSGVLNGSMVVVAVGTLSNATTTITGVQDDLGNVGVQVGRAIYLTNGYGELWVIKNSAAGNRTYTATYSATITNRYICAIEADGDTVSPLDKTSKLESQDSVNPHCPAVTTTTDGQYCVGLAAGNPGTSLTAVSPYADLYVVTFNTWNLGVQDRVQPTAGNTNADWTAANSSWFAIMGTFKAAAGGGGGVTPQSGQWASNYQAVGNLDEVASGQPPDSSGAKTRSLETLPQLPDVVARVGGQGVATAVETQVLVVSDGT